MDFFLEIFAELFLEGLSEFIAHFYIKLAERTVPKKVLTEKNKKAIRNGIKAFTSILFVVMILGILFTTTEHPLLSRIGTWTAVGAAFLFGLQLICGIILWIFRRRR